MTSVMGNISQKSEDKRKHTKMIPVIPKLKYENIFLQHLCYQIQKAMLSALG
jgi:hypothetical protein